MIGADRRESPRCAHRSCLLLRCAQRRRAFCDRAEPFHVFIGEQEIMRASFAADIDASRARLRRRAQLRGRNSHAQCANDSRFPPPDRSRCWIASSSASNRAATRDNRDTVVFPAAIRSLRQLLRHFLRLGMHCDDEDRDSAARCIPARKIDDRRARKIVDAAVAHECLQTDDAAVAQCFQLIEISGNKSAPEPEIDERSLSAAARFASKLAPSIVGGCALSGISKTVVVPPAAAAREPVANPSQSVRPGSLK